MDIINWGKIEIIYPIAFKKFLNYLLLKYYKTTDMKKRFLVVLKRNLKNISFDELINYFDIEQLVASVYQEWFSSSFNILIKSNEKNEDGNYDIFYTRSNIYGRINAQIESVYKLFELLNKNLSANGM